MTEREESNRLRITAGLAILSVAFVACADAGANFASLAGDPIAEVAPMPEAVLDAGGAAIFAEIDTRVDSWASDIAASQMTTRELVQAIDSLDEAYLQLPDEDPRAWVASRELGFRQGYLCRLLPADHSYRGGEFCA